MSARELGPEHRVRETAHAIGVDRFVGHGARAQSSFTKPTHAMRSASLAGMESRAYTAMTLSIVVPASGRVEGDV